MNSHSLVGLMYVVDKAGISNVEDFSHQFMDDYLLNQEIHGVTEVLRRSLHKRDEKAMDLLMGVQGWRRFIYQNESSEIRKEVLGEYCRPDIPSFYRFANGMVGGSRRFREPMMMMKRTRAMGGSARMQVNHGNDVIYMMMKSLIEWLRTLLIM